MILNGEQRKNLCEALSDAYRTYPKLEQMLSFGMNENLEKIAGRGEGLEHVVFKLVLWAEENVDRFDLFISKALEGNPGNPKLQQFINNFQNPVSEPEIDQLRSDYLNYLRETYYYFDMRGISQIQQLPPQLPLQEIYIPLKAYIAHAPNAIRQDKLWNQGRISSEDISPSDGIISDERIFIEDVIPRNPAIVVLGNPGSGKSTFLKVLTLKLATQSDGLLPVILPLNAYARRLQKEGTISLFEYLGEYYAKRQQKFADIGKLFKTALNKQQAIVLLDGLDEVQAARPLLIELIEEFVKEYIPFIRRTLSSEGKCDDFVKPTLPFELQRKIIEFLISLPTIDESNALRSFIYSAGLDLQLQRQINFANAPAQFFQMLVPTLYHYGKLKDGRNALDAVLESAKEYVGQEGQQHCARLIQELSTNLHQITDSLSLNIGQPSGNRIIVTSRIVGYYNAPLAANKWHAYSLTDFERNEIQEFARKWTVAFTYMVRGETEVTRQLAETECHELLTSIFSRPNVERLATNPLMLTILALVKYYGVSLPNERVRLYDLYLKTLIESRNQARALDRQAVGPEIEYADALQILAPLALWMKERNSATNLISRNELEHWLTNYYHSDEWRYPRGKARHHARKFLKNIQQASSLLVEWGENQYRFLHETLGEMLAAHGIVYLFDNDSTDTLAIFHNHLLDPNWHETLLLVIGIIGVIRPNSKQAGDLLQKILQMEVSAEALNRQIIFVGEALLDMGKTKVRPPVVQKIIQSLLQVMHSRETSVFTRYQAGELLGRLGDPRQEVLTLPPTLTSALNGRFQGGKYLITNAQFAEFIKAKGYATEAWWSEDGWWRRQEQNRKQPDYWEDKSFNTPNHPVVGVTWHEAEAFCCWLSTKYEGKYRLPKESEWEILAGGKEGYEYPWSNEWQENFANTEESGIGQTSAVGVFSEGISLTGAHDCAGNVWEWCDDWFDEQQNRKVLRGGAWNYSQEDARCQSRSGDLPHGSLNNVGFRVVLELG